MKLFTLSELSPTAAMQALRADELFSKKYGLKKINVLEDENLYFEDGRIACLTKTEQKRWGDLL